MSMRGAMRIQQCIPITCLCGPHFLVVFLVVWNINGLCNLPCAMSGIVRHGIDTQVTHLGKYLTMPYGKNATKQFF